MSQPLDESDAGIASLSTTGSRIYTGNECRAWVRSHLIG